MTMGDPVYRDGLTLRAKQALYWLINGNMKLDDFYADLTHADAKKASQFSISDIKHVPGCGPKTTKIIIRWLKKHGLRPRSKT
jgi:hypothetical protein